MRSWLYRLTPLLLLTCLEAGCGPGLYELPSPPPREDWRRHSLDPAEDDLHSRQAFLAAQESVLAFIEAMNEERYEDAYGLLSNETRILLDDLSPTGLGEAVLRDGVLERDQREYQVDPLDLFVIRGLEDILDEQEDELEAETYRRKELYAIAADGTVHHIVLIYESDTWHIHKPSIDLTPGAPGRRSVDL